jgi:hypothetical protein
MSKSSGNYVTCILQDPVNIFINYLIKKNDSLGLIAFN